MTYTCLRPSWQISSVLIFDCISYIFLINSPRLSQLWAIHLCHSQRIKNLLMFLDMILWITSSLAWSTRWLDRWPRRPYSATGPTTLPWIIFNFALLRKVMNTKHEADVILFSHIKLQPDPCTCVCARSKNLKFTVLY